MNNKKEGRPIFINDEFVKEHIRNIVITKGNAEKISIYLKKSKDKHLKGLAESIDEQIEKQGGY